MMEIGVGDADLRTDIINIHTREEKPAIIPNAETVTKRTITKEEGGGVRAKGCQGGIGSLDPGFDTEILQLQVGCGADHDSVAIAIKHKSLPDLPGAEGRISGEHSVIVIARVESIALGGPPAYKSRGWGRAGRIDCKQRLARNGEVRSKCAAPFLQTKRFNCRCPC